MLHEPVRERNLTRSSGRDYTSAADEEQEEAKWMPVRSATYSRQHLQVLMLESLCKVYKDGTRTGKICPNHAARLQCVHSARPNLSVG